MLQKSTNDEKSVIIELTDKALKRFLLRSFTKKYLLIALWHLNTIFVYVVFAYLNIKNWDEHKIDWVGKMFAITNPIVALLYTICFIIVVGLMLLEYQDIDYSPGGLVIYWNILVSALHLTWTIIYTAIDIYALTSSLENDRTTLADIAFDILMLNVAITELIICAWFTDDIKTFYETGQRKNLINRDKQEEMGNE